MLAYAAWSSASSVELSTCSTLSKLPLRPRLWGCNERPGSVMLGGVRPDMVELRRAEHGTKSLSISGVNASGCAPSCHATSLVYSPTRWSFKSRCIKILLSRARTIPTYIPKECPPVCRAARDSLVSPIPFSPQACLLRVPSLGGLDFFTRTLTIPCRTLCDVILTRVFASRSRCCISSCQVH